ncbi:hypothetical protein GGI24_000963 [Coemansia furcata]|nr:hypothetical protein GGI24_000963 [Coemansia furcata]
MYHLVKEIELTLCESEIYNGDTLERISRPEYSNLYFPRAQKIMFRFTGDDLYEDEDEINVVEAKANVNALLQWIKQLAPLLVEIDVFAPSNTGQAYQRLDQSYGGFVSQLLLLAKRVSFFENERSVSNMLQLDSIRDLTDLRYNIHDNSEKFIQLARQCASSLQTLVINSSTTLDVSGIVKDADGSYIVYPHLTALELRLYTSSASPGSRVFAGAVPFPKLRHLGILHGYPFDDDTLFRGNAATLEGLRVNMSGTLVGIIKRYNVFTLNSHPKLQFVDYWVFILEFVPIYFADCAAFVRFLLALAPHATVVHLGGVSINIAYSPSFSVLCNYSHIQRLYLKYVVPSLWDVIALVKSLPLLSDLQTWAPQLSPLPTGIDEANTLSHVFTNYSPIGERFRCWHVNYDGTCDLEEIVKCVLTLALACPNFTYVAVDKKQRLDFMEKMKAVIESPEFMCQAHRLRRLLVE